MYDCNEHKKIKELKPGDTFKVAYNPNFGHAIICPEIMKKYNDIIAHTIGTVVNHRLNYDATAVWLKEIPSVLVLWNGTCIFVEKETPRIIVPEESPCPGCSKMNDVGVRKCWWCEGRL